MKSALALTFHRINREAITSKSLLDTSIERYIITADRFEQAINMISPERCCTVSEYFEKKDGDCLIPTFDDGFISDFEIAFPILMNKKVKGTFFITAKNVALPGYTSVAHLREMNEAGMEIGSHGLTHHYLVSIPRNEAIREICESKEKLEQEIGLEVTSFAPVGGHYKKWMEEVAYNSGYRVFATMIPGRTNGGGDFILLRRNHIQSHHDAEYLYRLINGHYGTLILNRFRYNLLQIPKSILGIHNYDFAKKYLLKIFSSSCLMS